MYFCFPNKRVKLGHFVRRSSPPQNWETNNQSSHNMHKKKETIIFFRFLMVMSGVIDDCLHPSLGLFTHWLKICFLSPSVFSNLGVTCKWDGGGER